MIRTEREYKDTIRRLKQDIMVIEKQKKSFAKLGLSKEEIKKAIEPLLSFHQQLVEEVEWYKRIKRNDFDVISNISELGRLLIALRIASGLKQKDLAKCLGTTEAQVSRDERNEYHGISIDRAQKIIDIFVGAHFKVKVEVDRPLVRKVIMAHSPQCAP